MAHPAVFTVSNLGGSGIESFAAVINPPESAILAVGKVMPVVAAVQGMIAIQNRVNLTLSVDHRVASGKYAAEFLAAVVRELETFSRERQSLFSAPGGRDVRRDELSAEDADGRG